MKKEDAEDFQDLFDEEEDQLPGKEGSGESANADKGPGKTIGQLDEEQQAAAAAAAIASEDEKIAKENAEYKKSEEEAGEGEEEKKGEEKKGDEETPFEGSAELNFVKQFGIVDGMVPFDDGTKIHIDEMDPKQQFNVLMGLASSIRPAPEQEILAKYDLNQSEIDVLNKVREGKTLEQIVLDKAKELVVDYQAAQAIGEDVNYKELSADEVTEKFLRDQDPEATDEEIAKQLQVAKTNPRYEKIADKLKDQYDQEQTTQKAKFAQDVSKKEQDEIDNDRKQIVNAASSIDAIAGWPLNDDMKNEVLADLVEVNEEGDSPFMVNVLSSPEKLFEAAFFMKYGPQLFVTLDDYYKQQNKEAYEKGVSDAKSGKTTSTGKLTYNKGTDPEKEVDTKEKQTKMKVPDDSEAVSLESLYDD